MPPIDLRPLAIAALGLGALTVAPAAAQPAAAVAGHVMTAHGHVMTAHGHGLVGARVVLVRNAGRPDADTVARDVTAAAGAFRLAVAPGAYALHVRAPGFAPRALAVVAPATGLHVMLEAGGLAPMASSVHEVVVSVDATPGVVPERRTSTEDVLSRLPGVQTAARGGFAWEPQIRGMMLGPVALTLDGVPVAGACIDRMDPASSYVEPENLARIDVRRGGASLDGAMQNAGSLDLVTEDPTWGPPRVRVETAAEWPTGLRRVGGVAGVSAGRWAMRASGVYRQAARYVPGGGASALDHSGYTKRNARLAVAWRPAPSTVVTAQGLVDDAWNVGYPVLLMDATLAQGRIAMLRLEHRPEASRPSYDVRLYANRVDHAMDDRHRDVLARPVMRGMYMPMTGTTDAVGLRADVGTSRGPWAVSAMADVHRQRQAGTMWMYSLYPGIADMALRNVGDARALNGAAAVTVTRRLALRPRTGRDPDGGDASDAGLLDVTAQVRLDATRRDVGDAASRALLIARTPGLDTTAVALAAPSVSLRLAYTATDALHLHASLARTARLPTLVEHYGHYVYDYRDGTFYTGRPSLGAEVSTGLDVGATWHGPRGSLDATVFATAFTDHIAGADDPTVPGGATYRFRVYDGTGAMRLVGAEVDGRLLLRACL